MVGITEILFGKSGNINSDSRAAKEEVDVIKYAVTGQGGRPKFKGTTNGDLLDRINEGMLLVSQELYNAAIPIFQEAVDFLNAKPGLQYHDLLLEGMVNLGNALVGAERLTDARKEFKKIVDTDPNNGERALLYARVLEFLAKSDQTAEGKVELWEEAAKYLTRARTAGIPEERLLDFYTHAGVVFGELKATESDEDINSLYLNDILASAEEGFDYLMNQRQEKGFHLWKENVYMPTVCGKANRDYALRERRKDSGYIKLTDAVAESFEPTGNIYSDAMRAAQEVSGDNLPSTDVVDEDIYEPGSMADAVSKYKNSNVLDQKVVDAINLTRKGKLRNILPAIATLRELRDQDKDPRVKIQAAGALSGIYLSMGHFYAGLQEQAHQQQP